MELLFLFSPNNHCYFKMFPLIWLITLRCFHKYVQRNNIFSINTTMGSFQNQNHKFFLIVLLSNTFIFSTDYLAPKFVFNQCTFKKVWRFFYRENVFKFLCAKPSCLISKLCNITKCFIVKLSWNLKLIFQSLTGLYFIEKITPITHAYEKILLYSILTS